MRRNGCVALRPARSPPLPTYERGVLEYGASCCGPTVARLASCTPHIYVMASSLGSRPPPRPQPGHRVAQAAGASCRRVPHACRPPTSRTSSSEKPSMLAPIPAARTSRIDDLSAVLPGWRRRRGRGCARHGHPALPAAPGRKADLDQPDRLDLRLDRRPQAPPPRIQFRPAHTELPIPAPKRLDAGTSVCAGRFCMRGKGAGAS